MQIQDFLPYYPPNNENLQETIVKQKEFYELATDSQPNLFLRAHQLAISRFLSKHTMYDNILLYHQMGTGKTCASIAAIEQNRDSSFKRAIILTPSATLKRQYKNQVLHECMPHKPKSLSFYNFFTFCTFPGYNKDKPNQYENSIFVIDEVHKLKDLPHPHSIDLGDMLNGLSPDKPLIFTLGDKVRFTYRKEPVEFTYKTDSGPQRVRFIQLQDFEQKIIVLNEVSTVSGKILPNKTIYIRMQRSPYSNILNTLYQIKQKKVILMSGTPMTDGALEFTNIINLLNDEKDRIDSKTFSDTIKSGEISQTVKQLLYGKISYLRAQDDDIEVEYKTNDDASVKDIPSLTKQMKIFLPLFYVKMGDVQNTSYKKILDQDTSEDAGFGNQIQLSKISVAAGTITKANVSTNSCKFDKLLNIIKTSPAPYNRHFVYCEFVKDGVKKLQTFLKEYAPIVIQSTPPKKTSIVSRQTASSQAEIEKAIQTFNTDTSFDKPKILISSKMISEGITLKNISHVHVLTPHWNMAVIDQAIARGIRFKSHDLLKTQYPTSTPKVNIYMYTALCYEPPATDESAPENTIQPEQSIDYQKYQKSFKKDRAIKRVEKLLQDIAFDCNLHSARNTVSNTSNKDFTRDCYYEQCTPPACLKPVDIASINPSELEMSSYNLYYSDYNTHYTNIKWWIEDNARTTPMFNIQDISISPPPSEFVAKNVLSNIIYNEILINKTYVLKESSGVYYIAPYSLPAPTPIHIVLDNTPVPITPSTQTIPIPNVNPTRPLSAEEQSTLNELQKCAVDGNIQFYGVFFATTQRPLQDIPPFITTSGGDYGIKLGKSLTHLEPNLYGNLYISTGKNPIGTLSTPGKAKTKLQKFGVTSPDKDPVSQLLLLLSQTNTCNGKPLLLTLQHT